MKLKFRTSDIWQKQWQHRKNPSICETFGPPNPWPITAGQLRSWKQCWTVRAEVRPGLRWSSSKALNYSAMHTLYRFVSLHIAINNPVQNVSSEVEASFGFSRKLNQDKETVSWVAENQGFDHFNLKSEEVQEVGRPRERVKTVKHCNFKILRFGDCKLSCWETSSVLRLLCKLWCLLCWPAEGPCWLTFPVWRVWRAVDGPSFGK